MNIILTAFFILLFFNSCANETIVKEPYHYPNYKIIKPKITCTPKRENIEKLLHSYLGKPYVWAEEGPDAFDCSGLTYNIYGKMGINIPRTASEQSKMGRPIPFSELHYGDLIFFGSTYKPSKRINHVGIYLGNGWFAHASSKNRQVVTTNFKTEPIYFKRIKLCKRYLSLDEQSEYMQCSVPLKEMQTTDQRHTSPWKTGMRLPRKAVP